MMVGMVLMKAEFGAMGVHESNALKGDLYTTPGRPYANAGSDSAEIANGTVKDLLIPIISLVVCCVIGMIYTGGFFDGVDFVTAFSQSDASVGLAAYLIDATAAPVCIIAPISSWAAAVSGFVEGEDGLSIFVRAIPFNFYALLTIVMMVGMVLMKVEFGAMGVHESNALKGDLYTTPGRPYANTGSDSAEIANGTVKDLLIPIISLVVCCVIGMIYTGGFFDGVDFVTAFSQSDASVGLAIGSFFGLLITVVLYSLRRVLSFRECMACIPEGFKAMVPAILILTFAWSLKSMTDSLGAAVYVEGLVRSASGSLVNFLPAIIFVVACLLAFATGTSWGTFGILIPIVVDAFANTPGNLMIISISACMAGAVCGDHCSPISDTTIMASAGAQCDHVNHVSTQLPYAVVAAVVSFVTYICAEIIVLQFPIPLLWHRLERSVTM